MASRACAPPSNRGSSSRKRSSSTCSRNSTSSGWGRITSATSRSASPISEVTLCATDCDSLSAAFFSPSQSSSCSFSHQAASIAAMKVWWLRGSNSRRLSSWRSARMNSNSSGPDLPRMSCRRRARDSWVSPISSVTLAGSGSIGSGATTPAGSAAAPGPASGGAGRKSSRSITVSSASRSNGSPLPKSSSRPARLAGEARIWVTSTNSLPPAMLIGRGVVSCHMDSPRGFIGSVIICWWPTETYTWFASSLVAGIGNSVVIGRLWSTWKSPSTRHHSMSCGRPKCASIRLPSRASSTTCASVRAGCCWCLGSIASSRVPPPGTAWMATCLAAIVRSTTLPSRTL